MARKKIKNIVFTTDASYSILLSLLDINSYNYDETLFIVAYFDNREKNEVKIKPKSNNIYFHAGFTKFSYDNNTIKYIFFFLQIISTLIKRMLLWIRINSKYNINNANTYVKLIQVLGSYAYDYKYGKNIIIVEDGLGDKEYINHLKNNKRNKKNKNIFTTIYQKILGIIQYNDILKYITNNQSNTDLPIPVDIINIQEKWNNASEEKKKFILELFDLDIDILQKYQNFSILCTQPLSEDELINEEEKIDIYKRAIESISQDEKIVIKPHPREKTDYTKIFPNAIVLSNSFPMELIKAISIRFSKIYTVSSSVTLNFSESEIVLIKVKQKNLFQDLIIQTLDNNEIKYTFI